MGSYWVIVPAAGSGVRFQDELPKQYCLVKGKAILSYTLERLLQCQQVRQIVVAISKNDRHFATLPISQDPRITVVMGGETRMESVAQALKWIQTVANQDDWILVHDAVRAACNSRDITTLIESIGNDEVGGILAEPVRDTLKLVSATNEILQTISRTSVWQALTPQLFRFSVLLEAFQYANENAFIATDEAQMIEKLGKTVKVVLSRYPNPKLTYPEDLRYFEYLLSQTEEIAS